MSKKENKNETANFGEEFQVNESANMEAPVPATDAPATDAPAPASEKVEKTYTLKDGTQGSRAAYIRELFLKDNMSRKDISEKEGFEYRAVYSATVNMSNAAEPANRGRAISNPVVNVTADNKPVITGADGKIYVAGVVVETIPADLTQKARNTWIKEAVAAGVSRGDISKWLDLSYGVIYNLTKELDGTREKHDVTLEDGSTMSRSAYIRRLLAAGQSRADIAKLLEVPYSVVWQATKTEKGLTEKFEDTVAELKSFIDNVNDKAGFETILVLLNNISIVIPEAEAAEAAQAESAETAAPAIQ